MNDLGDLLNACKTLVCIMEDNARFPFGPPMQQKHEPEAKQACVYLCENDTAKAKALWRTIEHQCGGYVPAAAGIALIQAVCGPHIVVEAPEVS